MTQDPTKATPSSNSFPIKTSLLWSTTDNIYITPCSSGGFTLHWSPPNLKNFTPQDKKAFTSLEDLLKFLIDEAGIFLAKPLTLTTMPKPIYEPPFPYRKSFDLDYSTELPPVFKEPDTYD